MKSVQRSYKLLMNRVHGRTDGQGDSSIPPNLRGRGVYLPWKGKILNIKPHCHILGKPQCHISGKPHCHILGKHISKTNFFSAVMFHVTAYMHRSC
jgi:hypothetical protein